MDKVSVVIPVYNTSNDYLDQCINSILKQTYSNFEIIIINDGSKEETASYCDELALKDKRISVIHKTNEGVSVARNVGIDKASGKWIMFVDSDDYIKENAIEVMIKEAEEADIVISRIRKEEKKKIYGHKNKCKISSSEEKKQLINSIFIEKGNLFVYVDGVCSKLYLKSFLDTNNIRFIKGLTYGEDGIFNFRCYYLSNVIKYIPNITYTYRKNTNSVTHDSSNKIIIAHEKLFKEYGKILNDVNDSELYDGFNSYIIRQINNFCLRHIFNEKNHFENEERILKLKQIIEKEPYKIAIENIKLKYLTVRRKILAILLKFKLYSLIRYMYKCMKCIYILLDYIYEIKSRKDKTN